MMATLIFLSMTLNNSAVYCYPVFQQNKNTTNFYLVASICQDFVPGALTQSLYSVKCYTLCCQIQVHLEGTQSLSRQVYVVILRCIFLKISVAFENQ